MKKILPSVIIQTSLSITHISLKNLPVLWFFKPGCTLESAGILFRKIPMRVTCAMVLFKSSPGAPDVQPEIDTHNPNG